MKFLEISDRVCVNTEEIAWVRQSDDGFGCIIYVGDREYPADLPYRTFIQILTQEQRSPTAEKLDKFLSVATVQTL